MQSLLHQHPLLVPGVAEGAVACREFRSGAGPADLVILNPDGSLILVECKLAQNPQARREIVGQVLDYASRLWRMSVDDFELRWRERAKTSPFGEDDTAPASRAEVARQLSTGRFRIILAVDGINDDLRRMVEYLNNITAPEVSVLAIELARVVDGDVEILFPRVFGEELAQAKTTAAATAQPSWRRNDYADWIRNSRPELVEAMNGLLDAAEGAGLRVVNGTVTTPSLILGASGAAGDVWPVSLFTTPTCFVQVRFWNLVDKGYDASKLARALLGTGDERINLPALEAAGYRKRIDLDAEIFRASEARTALIDGVVAAVARPAGGGASGTQDGESS